MVPVPIADQWFKQGSIVRLFKQELVANVSYYLVRDEEQPRLYTAEFTLDESRRFELHLTDDQERKNKQPPEFVITVVPN